MASKNKRANPKTIKVLNKFYSKDDKNVFYEENKVLNVDVNSFTVLGEESEYAKDKNSVYYSGQKIEGANVKTFKVILEDGYDSLYSKDDKSVYVAGEVIKGADAKTFRDIPETVDYVRDKNNLYYYVKNLGKINENDFKILDSSLIKNGNNIYYLGEKLNIKNPEKFEVIKNPDSENSYIIYGKDDVNIYAITLDEDCGYLKIIKNADKNTFEVMKDTRYAKDKNNIYYVGYDAVQLQDVDKNSFVTGEIGFSHDKKNVYYAGRKLNDVSSAGFGIRGITNLEPQFVVDNKNVYKFTATFDDKTGEVKNVKTTAVKNLKLDPASFDVLDNTQENYYRDKNDAYYTKNLKKIESADKNSFVILDSEFSKDNKNVYYYGNKIKELSPDRLEFIGYNFGNAEDAVRFLKNKDKVYAIRVKDGKEAYEIVPLNVDANSFKYSNADSYSYGSDFDGYFQDKNGVYYFNLMRIEKLNPDNVLSKVEGADIPSFMQLMFGYAKDKNKVYRGDEEIKGADAKSFQIITANNEIIVKDKNKVYRKVK